MTQVKLPQILTMPPKLLPIIYKFNDYRYFYLEGGRGSAKTQSTARLLLYLAGNYKLRIVCGREIQNSIEESVYTVLKDLIEKYNLYFNIQARKITNLTTGSEFIFKGFREQGSVKIKGLEGVDILWIDEAQSVTKETLDVLIPTIRKEKSRLFFTMNRFMDDDAVHTLLDGREDCLHIHINYFENPYCPLSLKVEAETTRLKSERDYKHIYLGQPRNAASDMLFDYNRLKTVHTVQPSGETAFRQRIVAIDFAAQGDDSCVATVLDRVTNQHWKLTERIRWDEPNAMVSVGKIVDILGRTQPDVSILDVGGMGHVVHNRLTEIGVDIKRFDGASVEGVDTVHYVNARAHGYYTVVDWVDSGFLIIDEKDNEVVKQLSKIKVKYRSDGRRLLEAKVDMKKELKYSPDDADSLMMAVWAATRHLGTASQMSASAAQMQLKRQNAVRRTNTRRRK